MAEEAQPQPAADDPFRSLTGHGVIAGFGIPGREVANVLEARGVPFCVVELNPQTVRRLATTGLRIFQGDVTDEATLRRAGVERAAFFAVAVPDDPAVLAAVALARRLNPGLVILARCRRVSTALEAARRGADDVVSEEQVIGEAFARQAAALLPR